MTIAENERKLFWPAPGTWPEDFAGIRAVR
jgi:hypothetical protein